MKDDLAPRRGERKPEYCLTTNLPLLTREEEVALARRIRDGDESATHELVEKNIRLVVRIAGRVLRLSPTYDRDDAIMEGVRGLYRAASKFDPDKHRCKFSTYAVQWIRQFVYRGSTKCGDPVRVPDYLHLIKRRCNYLDVSTATPEEVAKVAECSRTRALSLIRSQATCVRLLEGAVEECPQTPELGIEGGQSSVDDRDELEWVKTLMGRLSEQEQLALGFRFRLLEVTPGREDLRSWEAVASELGLDKHQAKKIGWRAIRKLRVFAGLEGDEEGLTLDKVIAKKKRMVSSPPSAPGASDAVPRDHPPHRVGRGHR